MACGYAVGDTAKTTEQVNRKSIAAYTIIQPLTLYPLMPPAQTWTSEIAVLSMLTMAIPNSGL